MKKKIDSPCTIEISDKSCGLEGWLAIDSLVNNRCCGGFRLISHTDAQDVARLARAMTLKYGFLGLPHGGAKAAIICRETAPEEEKIGLLKNFALGLNNKLGSSVYQPHPDIGTDRFMLEKARMNIPRTGLVREKSGWFTSLGVIESIKAALRYRKLPLAKATALVEGFGKVGSCVALGLYNSGVKVLGISTSKGAIYSPHGLDIPRLVEMSVSLGSAVVENYPDADKKASNELLELDADILSPCSVGYTVTAANAVKVKARIIVPGANIPITPEAEEILLKNGVLCIPDFVANSGGVLFGTMEFAGFRDKEIADFAQMFFSKQLFTLFNQSLTMQRALRSIAEETALQRFVRAKQEAEKKSFKNNLFDFGLSLYRRKLVPQGVVRNLSKDYFYKRATGG
jgi:glutamate dehydrogenase (NAD(P)+)